MAMTPTKRRWSMRFFIGAAMIACFIAGRYWEHFKNGRWYEVYDSTTYDTPAGPVVLRHVTDSQGWPFLNPELSVLALDAPYGEVILYRSQRMFQEREPSVGGLQVNGNSLTWSDGINRYSLEIQKVPPATQPKGQP